MAAEGKKKRLKVWEWVVGIAAVVTISLLTAGIGSAIVSAGISEAVFTGAVIGGITSGITNLAMQSQTGTLNFGSLAIATGMGAISGAMTGGLKAAESSILQWSIRVGKIGLAAVNSVIESIQGDLTNKELFRELGLTVAKEIIIQCFLARKSKMNNERGFTIKSQITVAVTSFVGNLI